MSLQLDRLGIHSFVNMKTIRMPFQLQQPRRLWAVLLAVLCSITGCKENARLADHEVRSRDVQTISAYGRVLDQAAPPKDVVYVFLKAVLDDYDAPDLEKREAAFDTQLGTLATEHLKQRVGGKAKSEQQTLDNFYAVARRFAPVIGHYRETFREDYESLIARMYGGALRGGDIANNAIVYVNLDHPEPSHRPGGNVVGRIDLVRESGYWRIWSVSFDNTTRDWKQKRKAQRPANAPRSKQD